MIKVSVIIPVYRVEQYLPACLDSVLAQSLRELEVIAIDDAAGKPAAGLRPQPRLRGRTGRVCLFP